MKKGVKIPIIFGITGHRDLRDEDIPKLKEALEGVFREYLKMLPNTPLILISALAEGADMLAAKVALELGIELDVLIPYDEDEYLKSFEDSKNIEIYKSLKAQAKRFEVLPCKEMESKYTHCYDLLGKELAGRSNILIALWDGKESKAKGGTYQVLKYQEEGAELGRFEAEAGNAIIIIKTPRKKNPVKSDFKAVLKPLDDISKEQFHEILKKIERENKELSNVDFVDNSYLKSVERFFANKAKRNKKSFKNAQIALLVVTFVAFVSLEFMHVLKFDFMILGYIFGLILAFLIYALWLKSGKLQDDYVHSRGIREAIRVLLIFNGAKLKRGVAKYYLEDESKRLSWIRLLLHNIYYMDKNSSVLADDWIDGQIDYYKNNLITRQKRLRRLEILEKGMFILGLLSLIVSFGWYMLESFHFVKHSHFSWHHTILISSIAFLLAVFIGEKYIKIEALEEEIEEFKKQARRFEIAKRKLQKSDLSKEEYKIIIKELGKKALIENSRWLVMHDSRRVKFEIE